MSTSISIYIPFIIALSASTVLASKNFESHSLWQNLISSKNLVIICSRALSVIEYVHAHSSSISVQRLKIQWALEMPYLRRYICTGRFVFPANTMAVRTRRYARGHESIVWKGSSSLHTQSCARRLGLKKSLSWTFIATGISFPCSWEYDRLDLRHIWLGYQC